MSKSLNVKVEVAKALTNRLKTKTKEFPVGMELTVIPRNDKNTFAKVLYEEDGQTVESVISYTVLSKMIPSRFLELTEEIIEKGILDDEIVSIVGNKCYEEDGHDEDGWPSLIMAYGFI